MEEQTQSTETKRNNMMPIVVGVVVLLLLGGVAFFVVRNTSNNGAVEEKTESVSEQQKETSENKPSVEMTQAAPSDTTQNKVGEKTFTVAGKNYSFTPSEIRVKKGDKVKIVFTNSGGFHDWVIDEFNARTKQIGSGQTDTVEFVADKVGTFEYYCSVGNHRQMGMKGNLVVE